MISREQLAEIEARAHLLEKRLTMATGVLALWAGTRCATAVRDKTKCSCPPCVARAVMKQIPEVSE